MTKHAAPRQGRCSIDSHARSALKWFIGRSARFAGVEGEMTMMIGPDDWELAPGDAIYIPRDVPHGSRVTKGPVLIIEIFAPIRTDYLYFCEHQTTYGAPSRAADGTRVDERPRDQVPFSGRFVGAGGVRS